MQVQTLVLIESLFCTPESRHRLAAIIKACELGWFNEAKALIETQYTETLAMAGEPLPALDFVDVGSEIESQHKGFMYRLHQLKQRISAEKNRLATGTMAPA